MEVYYPDFACRSGMNNFILSYLHRYFRRRSITKRKPQLLLTTFILLIIAVIIIERKHQWHHRRANLSHETIQKCQAKKRMVYKDGVFHCANITKYVSYQPPGGGWNNQRIALENAVIMASLLRRTLLVHPLAPHDHMLKQKAHGNRSAGYAIYNTLSSQELVPISKIIDIKKLSFVVPVQEIRWSHNDFIREYSETLSWYNVCRNGLIQLWVDKLPSDFIISQKHINYIKKLTGFRESADVPSYRRECTTKGEDDNGVWEFLNELRERDENMIYFEKGSLFVKNLFFTNSKRALMAQRAIVDYIQPARYIVQRVGNIIHKIGKPFNAIHVRRTNHKTGMSLPLQHWLSKLTKANALRISKKLYIATDELNSTWFKSLVKAGYQIYFAQDFDFYKTLHSSNPLTSKDIIGIHEQLICSLANIFIPSYYSTFSGIIERYRQTRVWNRKIFRQLKHSSVKWLDVETIMTK